MAMEQDLAIIFAATIILALLRLLPEFRIWATPVVIRCSGEPLKGHERSVEYYFRTVLDYRGTLTITGRHTNSGRLKLRFRGKISDNDRQLVSAFLTAITY
jgi:hypothetical protein